MSLPGASAAEEPTVPSPVLDLVVGEDTVVGDNRYPPAGSISDPDVIEDWLEKADQALIDTRNGVTAISWPLALGSVLAIVALLADVIDDVRPDSLATLSDWSSLAQGGGARFVVCGLLVIFAIAAFRLAIASTEERQRLVAIRASYLRRRRELSPRTP